MQAETINKLLQKTGVKKQKKQKRSAQRLEKEKGLVSCAAEKGICFTCQLTQESAPRTVVLYRAGVTTVAIGGDGAATPSVGTGGGMALAGGLQDAPVVGRRWATLSFPVEFPSSQEGLVQTPRE